MCLELTVHTFPTQIPFTVFIIRVRSYCSHCWTTGCSENIHTMSPTLMLWCGLLLRY